MVDISPFNGILYNPEKIKNPKDVVTPPYDVITPEQQDFFYARHECSVIRLDLGKDAPADDSRSNKYTRAAGYFRDWQRDEFLKRDDRPAFYRYDVRYALEGGKGARGGASQKVLKGFFATVRLEPFSSGRILPHEDTFPKVKEDRLNLLRTARANFSPIMMLYSDPEKRIQSLLEANSPPGSPRIDFVHDDHTRQMLWSVHDPATLREIRDFLSSRTLLIADGHHRYETALSFSRECPEAERMMMLLVNMDDEGLSLLPIHRVIRGLSAERARELPESLGRYYEIETDIPHAARLQERMQEAGGRESVLGLYTQAGDFLLLRLRPGARERLQDQSRIPPELARLDVTLFDQLVLEDLLALKGGAADRGTHVIYIKEPQDGVEMVKRGEAQLAFFLNPIGIHVVQDLARKGIKMPHKSTYFYPKPLSGLVLNALPRTAGNSGQS